MRLDELAASLPTILLLTGLTIGLGAVVTKAVQSSNEKAAKAEEESKRQGSWGKDLRVQMGDKWADAVGASR